MKFYSIQRHRRRYHRLRRHLPLNHGEPPSRPLCYLSWLESSRSGRWRRRRRREPPAVAGRITENARACGRYCDASARPVAVHSPSSGQPSERTANSWVCCPSTHVTCSATSLSLTTEPPAFVEVATAAALLLVLTGGRVSAKALRAHTPSEPPPLVGEPSTECFAEAAEDNDDNTDDDDEKEDDIGPAPLPSSTPPTLAAASGRPPRTARSVVAVPQLARCSSYSSYSSAAAARRRLE